MGKLVKITKFTAVSLAVLSGLALLGLSLPFGGWKALSVQSESMAPSLKTGSLVFVKRVSASAIKTGDVITYINPQNKSQTITHRVQEVSEQPNGKRLFVTKGDANQSSDNPIPESRIVGKVSITVPYAGGYRDFVYTWPGLILLVYIPALIICIGEIRRLAAYYRRQHYILPEFLARRKKKHSGFAHSSLTVAGVIAFASVSVAIPAQAALQSSATLTGSSISLASALPPETEPPGGNGELREGDVTIRRVFISCGADGATSTVEVVLYNSQFSDIDTSGWTVKSGSQTVITLPAGSVIPARSLFESEGIKPDDISYSQGNLRLYDVKNEQKDEQTWSPDVYADRDCRKNT